jgi:hypothetical protein
MLLPSMMERNELDPEHPFFLSSGDSRQVEAKYPVRGTNLRDPLGAVNDSGDLGCIWSQATQATFARPSKPSERSSNSDMGASHSAKPYIYLSVRRHQTCSGVYWPNTGKRAQKIASTRVALHSRAQNHYAVTLRYLMILMGMLKTRRTHRERSKRAPEIFLVPAAFAA